MYACFLVLSFGILARLTGPGMQISNEEAKSNEISKLQKMLESLTLELDAAKLATINECNKNAVLLNQLELSMKEKSALDRELVAIAELRKENASLKVFA